VKGARIQVSGLAALKKKLGEIPQNIADEVDGAMAVASNDFVNRAVSDAPVNLGLLRNGISAEKKKDMVWEVVSAADYSAFVEWGTRTRVEVPADLANYAAKFKGGDGKNAKEAIYQWCKDKGIEEKFWWPIYIKIMTVGIHPHPFFFRQRDPVYKQLRSDLKEAIREALRK
jgi:HK97 gp10 family phage protein